VTEILIRQRIDEWANAMRAKDVERVLSLYAPNDVSFDLNPPLRYAGADNKRRPWSVSTEWPAPETCDRRLLTTQNIWKVNRPCSVVAGREPFASSNAYAGLTPKPYAQ
jgi:hypothetical protein